MAKKSNPELPDLSEMSMEQLVDALGEIKESRKKLESQEGMFVAALKARIGDQAGVQFNGRTYYAMLSLQERTALNQAKIRAEMSEEWLEQYMSTTEVKTLNVKRLET